MAYFDDPQKLAMWQRELAGLRERREQGGGASAGEEPREYRPEHADTLSWNADPAGPLREAITFEQLEVDVGVRKPGDLPTNAPQRAKQTPQLSQR